MQCPSLPPLFLLLAGWSLGVVLLVASPLGPARGLTLPVLLSLLLLVALWQRQLFWIGMTLGMGFGYWQLTSGLAQRLDPCLAGVDLVLEGEVLALPKAGQRQQRFELRVRQLEGAEYCQVPTPRLVRLTWYQDVPTPVLAGEHWRLLVRLRSPRGLHNPGTFDYERWLLAKGIDATGSVRAAERLSTAPAWHTGHWRQRQRSLVDDFPQLQHVGFLLALFTGDSALLADADWQLLRQTGTVHLLVISGLHLGLVAGLGFLLTRLLVLLIPALLLRWPARHWGGWGGLLLATLYAGCAGWSLPVARAWLMTVLGLFWLLAARHHHPLRLLLVASALILLLDPLAPLTEGFWLSFGAVAILLGYYQYRVAHWIWPLELVRTQAVLAVAMAPLLLWRVGMLPLVAPVANLIAVPLVGMALVPLVLLAGALAQLSTDLAYWPLLLVDGVVDWLLVWLEFCAGLDADWHTAHLPGSTLLLAVLGVGWVMVPLPWRWRLPGLLLLMALLPQPPLAPAPGEFRVEVLDVGQGLAVLVQTHRQVLVYDTGPRYGDGFDAGAAVVVPRLRQLGVRTPDLVLLSHNHNDHAGGFPALEHQLPPRTWRGGGGFRQLPAQRRCLAGQHWQWHGVRFSLLHPGPALLGDANDGSCVLLIQGASASALLPGDIERRGEARLLGQPHLGKVDLLLAPHHGSRSSSSAALLQRTAPQLVLISAGKDNRFGHPHEEVLAAYVAAGAVWYNTAEGGRLTWDSATGAISQSRHGDRSYWRVRD